MVCGSFCLHPYETDREVVVLRFPYSRRARTLVSLWLRPERSHRRGVRDSGLKGLRVFREIPETSWESRHGHLP